MGTGTTPAGDAARMDRLSGNIPILPQGWNEPMSRRLLALFLTALVAGCGFKGDLYLPQTPAPAAKTTHPAPQAPARPAATPDNRTAP